MSDDLKPVEPPQVPPAGDGYGKRAAAAIFDARAKGRPRRNVEIHVGETELAEHLARAWRAGARGIR